MDTPQAPIETDAVIVGAGPVGLFQVFELGLLEIKTHVIDSLAYPGGQCIELYPDKPIYDIPAVPVCTGRELTASLLKQIEPFGATFHFGQEVSTVRQEADGRFFLETSKGTRFLARTVFIAAGVGAFQPRKLAVEGLERFEGTQVHYSVKNPQDFAGKDIVLVGGGDSALDWALHARWLVMLILALVVVLNAYLFIHIPKGFFPQQDTGQINGGLRADRSISFEAMRDKLRDIVNIIRADPAVDTVVAFTGGSRPGGGFMFINLKPVGQRTDKGQAVITRLRPQLAQITGISIFLNPVQDLRAPKAAKPLPKALSVDEAVQLAAYPGDDAANPALEARDRCITELLYGCGLRIGELTGLDAVAGSQARGWVDLQAAEAHVLGKGSKRRSVPVGSKGLQALQHWLDVRGEVATALAQPALFTGRHGTRLRLPVRPAGAVPSGAVSCSRSQPRNASSGGQSARAGG